MLRDKSATEAENQSIIPYLILPSELNNEVEDIGRVCCKESKDNKNNL